MGMSTGGRSGLAAEINITPMIDVLLVLIIIFLVVSASLKQYGEEAQVPQPAPDGSTIPPPSRTIVLQAAGHDDVITSLRLNEELVEPAELRARLKEIYKLRAEQVIFLQADRELHFERIAELIDLTHADFPAMRVGLLTQPVDTNASAPVVARK